MAGWRLREVPAELAGRYREAGLWTDETLGSLLSRHLAAMSDLEVRIWSATRPYRGRAGELYGSARRLAASLARRGVRPGDVVAFQLPNWEEAAVTFWATSLLGAVVAPVVHFYGPKELGFILEQSGARVLVTADRFGRHDYLADLEAVRSHLDRLELTVVVAADRAAHSLPPACAGFGDLVGAGPADEPAAPREPGTVDPSGPALVAYTSGTTADPKGVIHTHLTLGAELAQMRASWPPDSRPSLMGAPVGHAIGMLGGLLGPVLRGRAVHLTDTWDPAAVLAAMVEGDLGFSGGATYFLTSLLDHPDFGPEHLERMRTAGLGGSPVPSAVTERAHALGISVIRSYGSTEHPSVTGARHDEDAGKRLHTDGHPLDGVELRLVGEDGRPVTGGAPGEVFTRGPELFAGYTDPGLTAAAVDADGWFSTGDIGVIDAEGWLTITDRVQDIIIRGGENISAREVEDLVAQLPGVAEVAVVAAPDSRLGEHACAMVRPLPGQAAPGLEDVRAHLAEVGLARQKWPEELQVVDDLPRTASGKVRKQLLRARLRRDLEPPPPATSSDGARA